MENCNILCVLEKVSGKAQNQGLILYSQLGDIIILSVTTIFQFFPVATDNSFAISNESEENAINYMSLR